MNHRERQIVCGLFLSKFDQEALDYLGFESFTEAFNVLGLSLQARPASIKNYRDELDSLFPNSRKGWHKRPLRSHCQRILDAVGEGTIDEIGSIVKGFLMPEREVDAIPEVRRVLSLHDAEPSASFAKRLITGRAAERYFASNYAAMPEFSGRILTDTTAWGCGFDFKLTDPVGKSSSAVEVKGIRAKAGQIQLTELEHDMAQALGEKYFLVLVRNFVEKPFHTVVRNPAQSRLHFMKVERKEIRVSWTTSIGGQFD